MNDYLSCGVVVGRCDIWTNVRVDNTVSSTRADTRRPRRMRTRRLR